VFRVRSTEASDMPDSADHAVIRSSTNIQVIAVWDVTSFLHPTPIPYASYVRSPCGDS